eukprot:TRINITY_DN64824_c0_g1_i1.p1 TRINITY_DN64824_c0_g1~~TRINITY_DN64824_c0_g1_i1.p1  ORF type:complete len:289 (+),score=87.96 TRINITY_DN64824_c0_g1_i1:98-964(+)
MPAYATLAAAAAAACPIQPSTNVVVYTGNGVGTWSRQWETGFWEWWSAADTRIRPAYLDSQQVSLLSCGGSMAGHAGLQIYVQPGGDAYEYHKHLGVTGKRNINGMLDAGKYYLGTCAGWYYAAGDYYWQTGQHLGGYQDWRNLLGRYETVEGSLTGIANYPDSALTTDSNGRSVVYYGGPTRGWRQTDSSVQGTVLSRYTSGGAENDAAAVEYQRMLLFSPHYEAIEGMGGPTNPGLTKDARIANWRWRAQRINALLGTDWTIPDGDGSWDAAAFRLAALRAANATA